MAEAERKHSCKECVFYIAVTGTCMKYGIRVPNPDDPPCLKLEGAALKQVEVKVPAKPSNSPNPSMHVPTPAPSIPQPRAPLSLPPPTPVQPPLVKYELTPTGIEGLDAVLGGGFIRGRTYLIAGETGTGKTLFSLQFLLTGAKLGEPGVYLAIDEPSDRVIEGLSRFGWDVTPYIKRKLLFFLDMKEHFEKVYLRGGRERISPRELANHILKYVERYRAKRLVIDPIAPLMYSSVDVLWAREYLRELIFALERRGDVTIIMTSEVPTGSKSLSRFGVEEFLATGIIVLSITEIKGRVVRVMYIRKMRWLPVPPMKFVFRIETGRGIVIEGPLEQYL